MTNVLLKLTLLGLFAVAGCAAASDEGPSRDVSFALHATDDNGVWQALPLGSGSSLAVHAEHSYAGALAGSCGPGYALDLVVDVGPVSPDSLQIDSVTVTFHPGPGTAVVPRKLDVWSNLTADKEVADGQAKAPAEQARYDIKRSYLLDPKDPIVVLELQSAGSPAALDRECRHTTRIVLYPQGAAVTPPASPAP